MEKIDLRHVSKETRETIRKQVVSLLKKKGKHSDIADVLNISINAVHSISKAFKAKGGACIKEKVRGRKYGEKRQLNSEQEKEIRQILIDKNPQQMKLSCMLWTRAAVCQLVKNKYGISITLRNMSEYLKRWGMTCQRPTKMAYFQDNVKLNTFMNETYPEIVKQAKKEDAVIMWGDETGVNNQEYYVRGFSPKGVTPEIASFSKIEKINMISAIDNYGSCRFMCYESNMTQQLFIDFLERLIHDSDRKVLFIVDNLKVHHGKIVQEWLENHKGELELFFTSPYSPEINPDEYLNHNLKQSVHSGIIPDTKEKIQEKVESFMHGLQKSPEKVKALFNHKRLAYIQKYGY